MNLREKGDAAEVSTHLFGTRSSTVRFAYFDKKVIHAGLALPRQSDKMPTAVDQKCPTSQTNPDVDRPFT